MAQRPVIPLWPVNCPHGQGDDPPRLVVYEPAAQPVTPRPAVIVCPGGGYEKVSNHNEGEPFAELLAGRGIVAFVCFYRVAPHRYPLPQADLMRAVRLVRSRADEWRIDPDRVGVLGFSAGGHNAATVATQPDLFVDEHDDLADRYTCRPDRLMLGYPVISLIDEPHSNSCNNLLGDDASEAMKRALSNELHVRPDNPPTFLFHTADDPAVHVSNSLNFAAALRRYDIPVDLHIYAHGPHGIGLATDHPAVCGWTELLLDWLADWRTPTA